jgi:hypothetical protein
VELLEHEWVLWALAIATGFHVLEEHTMGWQGWANGFLAERFGMRPTWADFYVTNAALVVFAFGTAVIGWQAPAVSLSLAALALINALFFHVLPSIQQRRPNPGLFSAVLLYIPIAAWAYCAASKDEVLSAGAVIGSLAIGAAVMASPIVLLRLKGKHGYPDVPVP